MLHWMAQKWAVIWLTLTSAPQSPFKLLRKNFKSFRYRLESWLHIPRDSIKFRCVETSEGNGVLHIVLGIPVRPESVWFDFKLMHQWWLELHGANQFVWREVKHGLKDAGKLSTYMITQYMGNQRSGLVDKTVRFSGSRIDLKLIQRIRRACTEAVYGGSSKFNLDSAQFLQKHNFTSVQRGDSEFTAAWLSWRRELDRKVDSLVCEFIFSGALLEGFDNEKPRTN